MTEIRNIHQRLAATMGEVSYVQKEKKPGMNYTVISHDRVTAKVRPALLNNGIVYYPVHCEHVQNGNRAECSLTVRFVNVDDPGDFFEVPAFGYGIDQQDKGPGKAMSYAVKYALLKALGLETGDEAEAHDVDHAPEDPATPPFQPDAAAERVIGRLRNCKDRDTFSEIWKSEHDTRGAIKDANADVYKRLLTERDRLASELGKQADPTGSPSAPEAQVNGHAGTEAPS